MTETDHAGLKELAEKATPGDWVSRQVNTKGRSFAVVTPNGPLGEDFIARSLDRDDAAYIAAVSPDKVLALLAENERMREALAEKEAALSTARREGANEAFEKAARECERRAKIESDDDYSTGHSDGSRSAAVAIRALKDTIT